MEIVMAVTVGALFASAVYLLLRRSIVKLALGIALLSQAVNLLVFTAAGLAGKSAAFVPPGAEVLPEGSADPLPQALILTAIVISFGVLAFTLAMVHRADKVSGSDDLDELRTTDNQ